MRADFACFGVLPYTGGSIQILVPRIFLYCTYDIAWKMFLKVVGKKHKNNVYR